MSPEVLELYLSLEPEDRQRVNAKIHELVSVAKGGCGAV